MSENIVATALEQAEYTKAMEVGRGVISKTGGVVVDNLGNGPFLLVADERTWAAARRKNRGRKPAGCRGGAHRADDLPRAPYIYASYDHAIEIRERLAEAGARGVAIGSGTINDLVKLASVNSTSRTR